MTMDKTEKELFPWDKISANTKRRITAELGMSKLHRLHEMDPFLLDLHANGLEAALAAHGGKADASSSTTSATRGRRKSGVSQIDAGATKESEPVSAGPKTRKRAAEEPPAETLPKRNRVQTKKAAAMAVEARARTTSLKAKAAENSSRGRGKAKVKKDQGDAVFDGVELEQESRSSKKKRAAKEEEESESEAQEEEEDEEDAGKPDRADDHEEDQDAEGDEDEELFGANTKDVDMEEHNADERADGPATSLSPGESMMVETEAEATSTLDAPEAPSVDEAEKAINETPAAEGNVSQSPTEIETVTISEVQVVPVPQENAIITDTPIVHNEPTTIATTTTLTEEANLPNGDQIITVEEQTITAIEV